MPNYRINPETLLYEEVKVPGYVFHVKLWLAIILGLGVVCLYFWLYVSVFKWEPPKTAHLKREHAKWESRMDMLNRRLDMYDQALVGIEQRDDDVYRSIYGLNPIPSEVKNSGISGNRYDEFKGVSPDFELLRTSRRMDNLIKRAYVSSKSLSEIGPMALQSGDMVSCVPAVPPLYNGGKGYRLTSRFGYRTDPVFGGGENHGGQDFGADRGTPVYATGDGIVEMTKVNPRSGYGNEIVINHGYGYQTRYAHLNSIEIQEGMRVQRGERIGTVGSTGKSTGPHLHYEVIYMGRRVNPVNYMDTEMPNEEYKAMIDSRAAESSYGKRSSTSDIFKKRGE